MSSSHTVQLSHRRGPSLSCLRQPRSSSADVLRHPGAYFSRPSCFLSGAGKVVVRLPCLQSSAEQGDIPRKASGRSFRTLYHATTPAGVQAIFILDSLFYLSTQPCSNKISKDRRGLLFLPLFLSLRGQQSKLPQAKEV